MPDIEKELEALRAALAVSPENVPLRLHLAGTLREAGRGREAVDEYRAALELDPNSAAGHTVLGTLLYELNELDDALATCKPPCGWRPGTPGPCWPCPASRRPSATTPRR